MAGGRLGRQISERVAEPVELRPGGRRHRDRLLDEPDERVAGRPHADRRHDPAGPGGSDAVEQLEDAEPRDLVPRVVRDPQHRERVLHVRGLEELQAPVLHERDVPPRELDLEHVAVVTGAEQHGLLSQRRPALAVLEDLPADGVGLVALVEAGEQPGAHAALALGPQHLLVPLRRERDHRVRRIEDRPGGAVVAFELDDRGPGEPFGELEDVAHGRRSERVDRLRVVADHHEPLTRGTERGEDVCLERVRVLVLVDEDVVERRRDRGPGGRVAAERAPEQEEVVVVERVLRTLAFGVDLEDRADLVDLLGAPRVLGLEDVGELDLGVHRPRVDVGERLLAREAPFALAESELAADQVHEVGRVRPVEHGEARRQAERASVESQEPVRRGVERAAPHTPEPSLAGQALGPREHLARGPAREREQQDALGWHAAVDQPGHPARERPRLARSGTRHHQERAAEMLDRRALLRVQGLEHAFEQSRSGG